MDGWKTKIGSMGELVQQAGSPGIAVSAPLSSAPGDGSDPWLTALRGTGAVYDEAVGALRGLLVRGARSEVARRWATMGYTDDDHVDAVAAQAADDALIALLAKLDDFHGESRFTTWACKFAVLEAGTRARLHVWRQRGVALDSVSWKRLADCAAGVDGGPEHVELLGALADGIDVLTAHQRCVVVALAIDRVPIDVLAERLKTTRGALYQTLQDARRQLRLTLLQRGLAAEAA